MSTANNCDCRFKVDWEDLAPVLQSKFKDIENNIIILNNSINTINKNIQNMDQKIQDILNKIIQIENKINNYTPQ